MITVLKVIVFDLDGTLIDSAPDLMQAANKLLVAYGRRKISLAETKSMIGDGAAWFIRRAFVATGEELKEDEVATKTEEFLNFYDGHEADNTTIYPNVVEALEELKQWGYLLGICTNKPQNPTMGALKCLGLDQYFDVALGGDQLNGVRKPDPLPLKTVLDRMGVKPSQAIMVGDNANDVGTAKALGVPVIVVEGGYTRTPAKDLGGDKLISGFGELMAAIQALT